MIPSTTRCPQFWFSLATLCAAALVYPLPGDPARVISVLLALWGLPMTTFYLIASQPGMEPGAP